MRQTTAPQRMSSDDVISVFVGGGGGGGALRTACALRTPTTRPASARFPVHWVPYASDATASARVRDILPPRRRRGLSRADRLPQATCPANRRASYCLCKPDQPTAPPTHGARSWTGVCSWTTRRSLQATLCSYRQNDGSGTYGYNRDATCAPPGPRRCLRTRRRVWRTRVRYIACPRRPAHSRGTS